MRFEYILLRRAGDCVPDFLRTAILALLQCQREQRASVWSELVAFRIKLFEVVPIAVAAFGVGVDHVSACLIVDRIAIVAFTGIEHRGQLFASSIAPRSVYLITGAAGQRQSINDISSHKRIGLVILPPDTAAVIMLIGVEPIH